MRRHDIFGEVAFECSIVKSSEKRVRLMEKADRAEGEERTTISFSLSPSLSLSGKQTRGWREEKADSFHAKSSWVQVALSMLTRRVHRLFNPYAFISEWTQSLSWSLLSLQRTRFIHDRQWSRAAHYHLHCVTMPLKHSPKRIESVSVPMSSVLVSRSFRAEEIDSRPSNAFMRLRTIRLMFEIQILYFNSKGDDRIDLSSNRIENFLHSRPGTWPFLKASKNRSWSLRTISP